MDESAEDREEHLLAFLYACPVGLVEIDRAGDILTMNPHAMRLLLPLAGGRDPGNLFAMLESTAPELRNLFESFGSDRGTICEGHRIVAAIGDRPALTEPKVLACTLVRSEPDRAIATIADVTAQVAQERRLKQAETWFASLINGVNDYAVVSIGPDGVIETANTSFERQTGHACPDVAGQRLDRFVRGETGAGTLPLAEQLRIARRDGWCLEESWQARRNGERYLCQRLIAARMGADPAVLAGYTVVLRDVVAQSAGEAAEMRRMLTRDHLTGAANRAAFRQTMEREVQRWHDEDRPMSLVMLDLDHFKAINDEHGHPAGDTVLRRVSETCTDALRPTDLFARLGGEEFAALLPGTSLDEALVVAERLRAAVAALQVTIGDHVIRITASLGCATAVDAGGTVDALVKQADDRLYHAKHSGRNRVCGPHDRSLAA